jgi:hypothetical protein
MRRVNRSMQQWWVDELARPPEAPPARSILPIVGWSVGTAIAASMIFCIWWGFNPDTSRSHFAGTQPANSQLTSGNDVALGPNAAPNASASPDATLSPAVVARADSSLNGSANTSSDPNAVEIVTVDTTTQHLSDLENSVHDDLVSARD